MAGDNSVPRIRILDSLQAPTKHRVMLLAEGRYWREVQIKYRLLTCPAAAEWSLQQTALKRKLIEFKAVGERIGKGTRQPQS